MKSIIKVQELFRHVDIKGEPMGPFLGELNLEKELSVTLGKEGDKIISLKTKKTIYKWNREKWQWELVESIAEKKQNYKQRQYSIFPPPPSA